MTDTAPERINGHAEPKVSILKLAPERESVPAPQPAAPAPVAKGKPQVRRRVRIDSLRRVFIETRQNPAYRLAVRHGAYIVGGTRVLTRRAWDSRTTARHERMMRIAEAAGQEDVARDWEQRAYIFRQSRHRRRMELLQLAINAPKAIAMGTVGGAGILLMLGIMLAWANHDVHDVLTPLKATVSFVSWVAFLAGVIWDPLLVALPWIALAGVWAVGRHRQTAPTWALPVDGDERDVVPDENAIMRALGKLGIAPLNAALKEGWKPRWVQPSTRSGNGWHAQLQLPEGVPVEMIADKKQILAHNLMRKPIEVWPTEPRDQAGVLDLWVADPGVLTKPVPSWPLLTEGTTDFFKGVPVALNARGEQVIGRLMAANYLIAGIMGSGKSSLVVALLLGAMLDPLVEIDVHVLAYNSDYDPMRPRLRSLVKGDDTEHVVAAMDTLRALASEVSRRGQELERLGTDTKVTREMAERDPSMRPRIVVFDEVHELFGHPDHGKEAKELALKVTKKARKTAIMLMWITPDADAASLPRGISKTVSHRVAFAINDHQGNDAILGTGMHKNGYSATTLVAGEDVGTAMAAGFGKTPGLIRSYYVRKEAGVDEVTPVVERAMALYEGTAAPEAPSFEPADHLADILTVLGQEPRMRTQDVLHRLIDLNSAEYDGWSPRDLKSVLSECGHGEYKTNGGVMHVSRQRIVDAIADRAEQDDDDF
ncbi:MULTISPECIES: cell division protein FtsK [unclassified Streptomyces]|uniref:cell division protein FtsK n=1 Tax=unclassified Streptomyces TaxID=2593676 RepID=UPI001162F30F|nr:MULTISPECIES: cell division protein FtsK [unclassified Streptomyces]NMI57117.1 cell division protein FtsK [Streptomyces sp. RLA2-12]QDN56496.1 cell division protein FtsK [Streptomyces sp. S1D4-20]QDN66673.1 cell division protein FtsK [Streptomyces sp. S1D4-14]QDO49080.1 cell division protein FtsK [Streptomyces sp. RLB3-5]QDO59321.1 cell division protein FtsK [Streptomyces sp. RLB1-8]